MSVYDDEKQNLYDNAGQHDNLGVDPKQREAETADLENQYNGGSAADPQDKKKLSDNDLKAAEKNSGSDDDSDRIPFRQEMKNRRDKFRDKKSQLLSKKSTKYLLFGGGGGGLLVVGAILITMLLFSSLKLMHIAQNITTWNLVRSSRTWRQSMARITEEQVASEVMEESTYNRLKARFGETKVVNAVKKLNLYRTGKMSQQVNSQLSPVFKEVGQRKFMKFLGTKKEFVGWKLDGVVIEKTDPKWHTPVANYREKLRISAEFQAQFDRRYPNVHSIVRNREVRASLAKIGIKLRPIEQKGKTYKDLTRQAATAHETQEEGEKRRTPRPECKVPSTCDASKAAIDAVDEEIDKIAADPDPTITPNVIGERTAEAGAAAINNSSNRLQSVLTKTSLVYTVVLPACLIYEGSLNNSAGTIDNSEAGAKQTFFDIRSSADQQAAGDVTPEAIGAKNDKYRNVSQSVPERRARGNPVDTIAETNPAALPQSSSTGVYSLFDAYLAGDGEGMDASVVNFIEDVVDKTCPKLTSVEAGIAFTAAEAALLVITAGTSSGVEGSAKVGVQALMSKALTRLTTKTVGKGVTEVVVGTGLRYIPGNLLQVGGRFAVKTGVYAGATFGLTELARVNVLKHSNLENAGHATDELAVTQADMGANAYNSDDLMRKFSKGIPLPPAEVAQDRSTNVSYLKNVNSAKSSFERYLAIDNADSLVSKVGMNVYAGISEPGWVSGLVSSFANIFSRFGGIISGFGGQSAEAQSKITGAGEYNIVQWGYTAAEENLIETDDEFSPLLNELILEQSGKADDIEDKYGKCYTKTMGELLADGDIRRETDGAVIADAGDCAPNKLSLDNNEFGDKMVFRWRLQKRYDSAREHLVGIQEPSADTASDVAIGGAGVTCPASLEAHPTQAGYFKMPDAPNGEYTVGTTEAQSYGSKQLVCVLYTVGINYAKLYPGKSKLIIGDLNATGHQSHYRGVAVDINAGGEIAAADHLTPTGTYNTEATIALGKLFVNTKSIASILWCEPGSGDGDTSGNDGSMNAIREFGNSISKPLTVKCIAPNGPSGSANHSNHFHVNLDLDYALPGSFKP